MAIPLIEQEIIEVVMKGVLTATNADPKTVSNFYYFRRTTFATPWTKAAVDAAFQADIGDVILDCLSSSYTQSFNLIRCIDDVEDAYGEFVKTGPGTVTGDRLPSNAAAVIDLKSGIRGAYAQGRKFFRGLAESSTTMDLLNAGAITLFTAAMDALLAGFTDGDGNVYVPVIVSFSQCDLSENPTTVVAYDMAGYKIRKNIRNYKKSKQRTIN